MPRKKKTDNAPAVVSEPVATTENSQTDAPQEELIVQYAGGEWSVAALKEKAIAAYVAEGHRRGNIKKFVLYVKPEEHMAYYVVNDKNAGGIDFE